MLFSILLFLTPPKAVQAWAKKGIQLTSGPKLPKDSRVSNCSMGSFSSIHFSCSSSLLHDSLGDIWDTRSRHKKEKKKKSISTCISQCDPREKWHFIRISLQLYWFNPVKMKHCAETIFQMCYCCYQLCKDKVTYIVNCDCDCSMVTQKWIIKIIDVWH